MQERSPHEWLLLRPTPIAKPPCPKDASPRARALRHEQRWPWVGACTPHCVFAPVQTPQRQLQVGELLVTLPELEDDDASLRTKSIALLAPLLLRLQELRWKARPRTVATHATPPVSHPSWYREVNLARVQ
eukprot:scaffold194744_cov30-Tisochrysis_lutea.AAC.5